MEVSILDARIHVEDACLAAASQVQARQSQGIALLVMFWVASS